MKVRELIENLSRCEQDLEVYMDSPAYSDADVIESVKFYDDMVVLNGFIKEIERESKWRKG